MAPAASRLQSASQGWPAVVLIGGLGTDDLDWLAVQHRLAAATQVLRWDRPDADADAAPRDIDALVDELHALLHEPGLRSGACVLVGHSFGGLIARRYAQRHRKDAAALVLVDAMHEDQFERLAHAFPAPAEGESPALARMRDFFAGGWRDPAHNAERIDLPRSLDALRAGGTLGDLPLVVLSAGSYLNARLFGERGAERLQAQWGELQNRLAALSGDVEQVVVEQANHFVPRSAPEVVVDAVLRLVERLRAPA